MVKIKVVERVGSYHGHEIIAEHPMMFVFVFLSAAKFTLIGK
jgi:hypothetical protein